MSCALSRRRPPSSVRHSTLRTSVGIVAIISALWIVSLSAQTPPLRRVMFDEAHHNLMASASSGYRPFVLTMTDADFTVTRNLQPFSAERLAMADIIVSVNPNGADQSAPVESRAGPAYTAPELDALEKWVANGGGLLLVTDHYPTGPAAQVLGDRFGVHLSGGWTDDPAHRRSLPGYGATFGYLVFSRENGLLGDHPITRGLDRFERVNAITTTTGGSIEGPAGSVSLLRLSPTAVDWIPSRTPRSPSASTSKATIRDFNPCPDCDRVPAGGRSQGIALEFGRGRIVIIGEMGALVQFSISGMDNRQFALNIVRWLAREL